MDGPHARPKRPHVAQVCAVVGRVGNGSPGLLSWMMKRLKWTVGWWHSTCTGRH